MIIFLQRMERCLTFSREVGMESLTLARFEEESDVQKKVFPS